MPISYNSYKLFPSPALSRASRPLMFLMALTFLSPLPNAAELEPELQEDPLAPGEVIPPVTPDSTHANREAPQELMNMAVHQPENFIGKTLILDGGANDDVIVGPIKDIRRRVQNQQLYLIVDATDYFNTQVDYAVAVRDLDRIEEDTVVIPETPGMHLNGMDYYPDDYTEVQPDPVIPVSEHD